MTELHFRYVACTARSTDTFLTSIHCSPSGTWVCVCVFFFKNMCVFRLIQCIRQQREWTQQTHPAADQITLALTHACTHICHLHRLLIEFKVNQILQSCINQLIVLICISCCLIVLQQWSLIFQHPASKKCKWCSTYLLFVGLWRQGSMMEELRVDWIARSSLSLSQNVTNLGFGGGVMRSNSQNHL